MTATDSSVRPPRIDDPEPTKPLTVTGAVPASWGQVSATISNVPYPMTFKLSRPLTFHEALVLPTHPAGHRYKPEGDKITVWNITSHRAAPNVRKIQKNLSRIEQAGKDRRLDELAELYRRNEFTQKIDDHLLGKKKRWWHRLRSKLWPSNVQPTDLDQ